MAVDLLTALASIPPEHLVEGAEVTVAKTDGSTFTITVGERVEIEDDNVFSISYRPRFHTAAR